jgi:predicted amidohydrolase YtcJ
MSGVLEAEKITLQQAFDLLTVNSARQMGHRSKTGSIEKGVSQFAGAGSQSA